MVSLKMVRNSALIICFSLITGWVGWFIGHYNITSLADIPNALAADITAPNSTQQTINRAQPDDADVDMDMFWLVWDRLEKQFLFKDRINYQKMVYGATKGMTAALEDPYTAFFPPADNKISKENLNGAFGGVGIELGYKMGTQLVVIAPISGMAAEKAGVKAGDFILKITDEAKGINKDTYGLTVEQAVQMIRGEKGTKVTLQLLHDGSNEPYSVDLIRDTIIVPSVDVKFGKVVNGEFVPEASNSAQTGGKVVARLILSRFGDRTDEQWDKAVSAILGRKDQVGGVVLDLRNNPGGLMQGAVNLAAEFLPTNQVVMKQESTLEADKTFSTQRYGRLLNMPLVVLTNKGSASASEILAGALRDHNRAKLVGETTFGKGIIQSAEDLSNGAGLHVTIARWLTPNGTWVHEKGLTPDVEVALDKDNPTKDVQLNKAAELVLQGK